MSEAALDRETIGRVCELAGDAPLLIALSGGGDSTALLHLMVEHVGPARVRALVVDHALRAGSDDAARSAAGFAVSLGVAADILTMRWPDVPRPAQAAAREARYGLLCDAARALNARILLTAHTADDQAETVLMRAASGSSWRGLAGMAPLAPAPIWPEGRDIILARPLLRARRAALRDLLRERGADWIEDTANENTAYARVRARRHLAALEQGGFEPMGLARLGEKLRPLVEALDIEAAGLIAEAARFDGETIELDIAAWKARGREARLRALSVLIAAAAGAAREPAAPALERVEARLREPAFRGASLGGARLQAGRGRLRLSRDRGALLGRAGGPAAMAPLALPAGVETVWDGRLALMARAPGWAVQPSASGAPELVSVEGSRELIATAGGRWLLADRVAHLLGRFAQR